MQLWDLITMFKYFRNCCIQLIKRKELKICKIIPFAIMKAVQEFLNLQYLNHLLIKNLFNSQSLLHRMNKISFLHAYL